MNFSRKLIASFLLVLGLMSSCKAQKPSASVSPDQRILRSTVWQPVPFHRGGRSTAVCGVPGKPQLFYMGATGGGVWKTEDAGTTWENISDGYFGGSIGSIAVAPSDDNVIYVGGGEESMRGNVSFGYGIWKSTDRGENWTYCGLPQSRHVARIRIHPLNPDIVYAAVMGDLYKNTEERGVYQSIDGGKNWKRILFAGPDAGANDLVIDPTNHRILYASTWNIRRTPYSLESGGSNSKLWKSTDEGKTWIEISTNSGFPKGLLGKICVAVSPIDNQRVFATVEHESSGGLYRSDDGGKSWIPVNGENKIRQRAWYFSRVYADTYDKDKVYVMNVRLEVSTDGGKSFRAINTPHVDHHDMWIAPEDSRRMIIANDGGAQVSVNGGKTWSSYHNQPTAQFYRIATDNAFPYRIYVAQQDNSTVRINHLAGQWEPTAGGESAHLAADPRNPEIVYGGNYGGYLTRLDHRTDQQRAINVWPDNTIGHGAESMKYRFQWNFPVLFSRYDSSRLYVASNHVHISTDGGNSWKSISPDLTRNDSTKLGPSGGPITKDNTGVEVYCTIFALAESRLEKGVIWAGSDDGLIHITRNDGDTWQNITPGIFPEWLQINSIDADPFNPGGLYVAGTRYKTGDYRPYLFYTPDYGKTWQRINQGIASEHFTRVIRSDLQVKGLLYCGTESGMYYSSDQGKNWKPFQNGLPVVPITDLEVRDHRLLASTQGRGVWKIDDLSPLRYAISNPSLQEPLVFDIPMSYRVNGSLTEIKFVLPADLTDKEQVVIDLLDEKGRVARTFARKGSGDTLKLTLHDSVNVLHWDRYYAPAKKVEGMYLWWASLQGPVAAPGKYLFRLYFRDKQYERPFVIGADPRAEQSQDAYEQQFAFLLELRDKVSALHGAFEEMRNLQSDLKRFEQREIKHAAVDSLKTLARRLNDTLMVLQNEIYQTKNRSEQDMINYPIRINNKLAHLNALMNFGNYPPTVQAIECRNELFEIADGILERYERVKAGLIKEFNDALQEASVPYLEVK